MTIQGGKKVNILKIGQDITISGLYMPATRGQKCTPGADSQCENLDPGSRLPKSKYCPWEPTPRDLGVSQRLEICKLQTIYHIYVGLTVCQCLSVSVSLPVYWSTCLSVCLSVRLLCVANPYIIFHEILQNIKKTMLWRPSRKLWQYARASLTESAFFPWQLANKSKVFSATIS